MNNKYITIPPEKLIDIFLEVGIVPNGKLHFNWNEVSEWQIENLIKLGMKPQHKLLDVGCGPIRLGMQAISYLEDGNYYGIDAFDKYIDLIPFMAEAAGITKKYNILYNRYFEFEKLGNGFDFAIAQSVFTHLSKSQIIDCMHKMKKVMAPGSKFLFTNIESKEARGFLYIGYLPMIAGTHCSDQFYQDIAKELNIEFQANVIPHHSQTAHLFKF